MECRLPPSCPHVDEKRAVPTDLRSYRDNSSDITAIPRVHSSLFTQLHIDHVSGCKYQVQ